MTIGGHELLFVFNASKEGTFDDKEIQVNFENDTPNDISKGKIILRTAFETRNKVEIPIKQMNREITLNQLKKNLQQYLPRIVYVDKSGFV